jgi:hypothetical protein
MKKILLLLFLNIFTLSFGQAPEMTSYQAIIRDNQNQLIQNANVGIRISILQGSINGTSVYSETHTVMTNQNGLITLNIGGGVTSDDFSNIDWGAGSYFIKTETDPTGGVNYTITGASQLLSVPYALYAKKSGDSDWNKINSGIDYENGNVSLSKPGSSLILTSPNGTKYEISVNDNGELSLPTSNQTNSIPDNLYLYGSFNDWDPNTALKFARDIQPYTNSAGHYFIGVKYFEAGTKIKFLANRNESIVYGGYSSSSGELEKNADAIEIPSSGFYRIRAYLPGSNSTNLIYGISHFKVYWVEFPNEMKYDITNDEFYIDNTYTSNLHFALGVSTYHYGDNLGNGEINYGGNDILLPEGLNYDEAQVKLKLNFNLSGTYSIIQK